MPPRTNIPAAASPWVARQLTGSRHRVPVVASGPHAVYVESGGWWIGVLDAAAVAVPSGLRTTLARLPEVGREAYVGEGALTLDSHDVRVARLVDVQVPPLRGLGAVPHVVGLASDRRIDAARAELPDRELDALAAGETGSVDALLGRGSGLTPLADDVLAGWLVARHTAGWPTQPIAGAVKRLAARRTTPLSATLLHRAAEGEAIPQLRDLLLAWHAGVGAEDAVGRLLAVGHTSGAGLALGALLGLRCAAGRVAV